MDFSDQVDTRPFSFLANVMAEVRVAYRLDSYRRTDLITTITPMLRMPKTAANYSYWDDWSIHNDAWAIAVANGYDPDSYDRVIMHWQSLRDFPGSNMKWSGYGQVGGRYIWLNGWFNFKAVSHELGHTYGNWHVTRSALQNVASISGLLLTTEAIITESPEKEKGGSGGGIPVAAAWAGKGGGWKQAP